MFESIFITDFTFKAYTSSHFYPLIIGSVIMALIVWGANRFLSSPQQRIFGTALGVIPLLCVLLRMWFTYLEGRFTIQEELPLHLCRILAFAVPFMMYFRSKKWFGILYFLIIVGTIQALLTPDLNYDPPHWSYYSYWILHTVLVWIPIYAIVVYKFRPNWQDFKRSFIIGNIYMLFTLAVNFSIESNYFFTRHKPPVASLLDLLGPWPYYILSVELLALVLFLVAMTPFITKNPFASNTN